MGRAQVKLKGFKSLDTCPCPVPLSPASFPASSHFPAPWQPLGQELNAAALHVTSPRLSKLPDRNWAKTSSPLLSAGGGTGLGTSLQLARGVQHSPALPLLWERGLGCCCMRGCAWGSLRPLQALGSPQEQLRQQHLPFEGGMNPFPRAGKGLQGAERPLRASIHPSIPPVAPSPPPRARAFSRGSLLSRTFIMLIHKD